MQEDLHAHRSNDVGANHALDVPAYPLHLQFSCTARHHTRPSIHYHPLPSMHLYLFIASASSLLFFSPSPQPKEPFRLVQQAASTISRASAQNGITNLHLCSNLMSSANDITAQPVSFLQTSRSFHTQCNRTPQGSSSVCDL